MTTCDRCRRELRDELAAPLGFDELTAVCRCCRREVMADAGGWPMLAGPRAFVCSDCNPRIPEAAP
jgi:hypothetical protein